MPCSTKDKIPTHQKSNVVKCPENVKKTDRCVITRLNEHSNRSVEPTFQHLQYCEKLLETMALYQLPNIDNDVSHVNLQAHILSRISDTWRILDSHTN